MRQIVVALDGSPQSDRALEIALQIAPGAGASLLLAYVCPPIVISPDVYGPVIQEIEQQHHKEGEVILERGRKRVSEADVPFDKRILSGPIAESIVDLAENSGADLVVVGSRGRGAVARVLLGSVADRVVHISRRPVLVVH